MLKSIYKEIIILKDKFIIKFDPISITIYLLIHLGIGDWGLGIGDWGLGPIPNPHNPQSPIPNPQ